MMSPARLSGMRGWCCCAWTRTSSRMQRRECSLRKLSDVGLTSFPSSSRGELPRVPILVLHPLVLVSDPAVRSPVIINSVSVLSLLGVGVAHDPVTAHVDHILQMLIRSRFPCPTASQLQPSCSTLLSPAAHRRYDISDYAQWWPESMPELQSHALFVDCRREPLALDATVSNELLPQVPHTASRASPSFFCCASHELLQGLMAPCIGQWDCSVHGCFQWPVVKLLGSNTFALALSALTGAQVPRGVARGGCRQHGCPRRAAQGPVLRGKSLARARLTSTDARCDRDGNMSRFVAV